MPEPNLPTGFVAALRDLTRWLDAERASYVLIGGVSVSLLAQPRATQDIDLTVWIEQERWDDFLRAGESFGFTPRLSDALAFAAASRVLLLRHQPSGVSVDLAFGSLEFEREMIWQRLIHRKSPATRERTRVIAAATSRLSGDRTRASPRS